jgi:hypothetical protein
MRLWLFGGAQNFFFGLKPIIEFGARLIAAFDIEFVSATADAFFERKGIDQGFLCTCGWGHGITSAMTVSQKQPDWKALAA